LFGPIFFAEMPSRVNDEIAAAIGDARDRRRFKLNQVRTFLRAPLSMSRMAARARLLGGSGSETVRREDCGRIVSPTLVLTGEAGLDHVVPPEGSSEYIGLISGARAFRMGHSGHLGCITRPHLFADAVREFLAEVGVGSTRNAPAASRAEDRRSEAGDRRQFAAGVGPPLVEEGQHDAG
jgi:pimeloyl-ACP methyl ester carboxylesterase